MESESGYSVVLFKEDNNLKFVILKICVRSFGEKEKSCSLVGGGAWFRRRKGGRGGMVKARSGMAGEKLKL